MQRSQILKFNIKHLAVPGTILLLLLAYDVWFISFIESGRDFDKYKGDVSRINDYSNWYLGFTSLMIGILISKFDNIRKAFNNIPVSPFIISFAATSGNLLFIPIPYGDIYIDSVKSHWLYHVIFEQITVVFTAYGIIHVLVLLWGRKDIFTDSLHTNNYNETNHNNLLPVVALILTLSYLAYYDLNFILNNESGRKFNEYLRDLRRINDYSHWYLGFTSLMIGLISKYVIDIRRIAGLLPLICFCISFAAASLNMLFLPIPYGDEILWPLKVLWTYHVFFEQVVVVCTALAILIVMIRLWLSQDDSPDSKVDMKDNRQDIDINFLH